MNRIAKAGTAVRALGSYLVNPVHRVKDFFFELFSVISRDTLNSLSLSLLLTLFPSLPS